MQSTPVYEAKLCGGMIMTIVCLGLSLSAYLKLKEISGDVYDILDNWKAQPVLDVYVPQSYDEDCPSGYGVISLEKSKFTGFSKGPCGCTINPSGYTSTIANCSDTAEATNYCMSAPAQGGVSAQSWREGNICYKRGGEPATSWTDGYYRRPYPDENGKCPEKYKKCGRGKTYAEGAVCFPADSKCPVTGLLVTPSGDLPPASGRWEVAGTFPGGDYVLLERREHDDELPLVDVSMQLTYYNSDGYLTGDGYDPDENKRGPCYLGVKQVFSSDEITVSDSFLWTFSVTYPSTCTREDKRYELFDRRDLQNHFLENLAVGLEECAGAELLPLDDADYDASLDPDYINSGVPCGTTTGDFNSVCARSSSQFTDCDSSDELCDVIINQNVCGQYAQAARGLAEEKNTFGMYRRSEILWKEDCAVSPDDIYTNVEPLAAALAAQLAGVVLSFILGIVFGVCIPVYGVYATDHPAKKFRINTRFEAFLLRIDPVLHVFKLGPLIAAIIYIGQVRFLPFVGCLAS
jgi:hypothetical protein